MSFNLSSVAHRLFGMPHDDAPVRDPDPEPPLSATPLSQLCPDLAHELELGIGRVH
jgi:hypothetical protein